MKTFPLVLPNMELGVRKKLIINLTIFSMIVSMCGGGDDSTSALVDEATTTSSTTTFAPSKVEVFNEAELVVPPILLKPLGDYKSSVYVNGKYYKKMHANDFRITI